MCGMWAIRCQSSPVQNLHRSFSNGQSRIVRKERELGSRSSVKDWSLGPSQICNFRREVSSWSPIPSRDMRFGGPEIVREVREGSPCRPHSTWDVSLSQFLIDSEVRSEGRPCIGNINSGQCCNVNDWKHVALCSSDLRFSQPTIEYREMLRAGNSIDTRLGHLPMFNQAKVVRSPPEIEMESKL